METHTNQLKAKLRKSEEDVNRLENKLLPKIKETKKF